MMLGLAIDGERRMLILGLSRKNVERLMAGEPIYLSRRTHVFTREKPPGGQPGG